MAESATKKRKFEGDSELSIDQVGAMVSVWDSDQLRRVLCKIGSMSSIAIDEIKAENNNDPKMKKIFVRNLPFTLGDAALRTMFEQWGVVQEAVVIMDKMKGQSKGFGFVTFETIDAANASLEQPVKEVEGRQVFVNLAAKKDTSTAPAHGGVGTAPTANEDVTMRKLFVRSLSYDTSSETLHEFFTQFGEVSEAVVLTNRDTGASKGYGFVTMALSAGATTAMQEPTKQLGGRTVYVKLAASNDGSRNSQQQQGAPFGQNPAQNNQFMNQYQMMSNMMMNGMGGGGMGGGGMGGGGMGGGMGMPPGHQGGQQQYGQQQQQQHGYGQQPQQGDASASPYGQQQQGQQGGYQQW